MRPRFTRAASCGCLLAAMVLATADTRAQNPYSAPPVTATFVADVRVKLTVSPSTLDFPSQDPEVSAPVSSVPPGIDVSAKVRVGSEAATLTVHANRDLQSGSDVIPVDRLKWTAAAFGFDANGVMSISPSQRVGSWSVSGEHKGTLAFTLDNSWTYATGYYRTEIVFTLSVP